jgi:predicted RNA binding protein YcfA (HicA-like mRNA interferase family)
MGRKERISLPLHGNMTLKIGIQKHIMKIADIREEDL